MDNQGSDKMGGWTPPNGLSNDLNHRFSTAIMNFNAELSGCRTGALVQVWMPEMCRDGNMVLQTKGLPFSISGVGDLLALFRCVSCRYRFITDISKPHLMGVIGRVYSSGQPELCYDVQRYDSSVYLRASEAQRCRVHSTLVTPVYLSAERERAVSVVEVSHHDKDVKFLEIINRLSACLESVQLYMADIDINNVSFGLRNWAVDVAQIGVDTVVKAESEFGQEYEVTPPGYNPLVWAPTGSPQETADMDKHAVPAPAPPMGGWTPSRAFPPRGRPTVPGVASAPAIRIPTKGDFVSRSASGPLSRHFLPPRSGFVSKSRSGPLTRPSNLHSAPPCSRQGILSPQWSHENGSLHGIDFSAGPLAASQPAALSTIRNVMEPLPASTGLEALNIPPPASSPLPSIDVPAQPELYSSDSDGFSDVSDGEDGDNEKSGKDSKPETDAEGGQLERANSSGQTTKNDNRLGGGAGKRLTFKDLQGCFGVGLKEAAAQLGICPTTLKRACRRNGISRWPSRQISKLSKAWHQMGYQGSPPAWLVRKAITGNLKCDNLVFSLNAGLHLGLMQGGGAQPTPALPQSTPGWSTVNRQSLNSLSAPTASGLARDADLQMGQPACQLGPSTPPLPPLPADQPDFFDEMAGMLQEPAGAPAWQCPTPGPSSLHALNPEHEARRVFRSNSAYGSQAFQCASPDFSGGGIDARQHQGKEQLLSGPALAAFDGLGDSFATDIGFANTLGRAPLDNVTFSGVDGTPSVNELGIASGLF